MAAEIFFLGCAEFFSEILISKIGLKMNFRLITKSRAADPEIEILTRSILKPYGSAATMPTAWVPRLIFFPKPLVTTGCFR